MIRTLITNTRVLKYLTCALLSLQPWAGVFAQHEKDWFLADPVQDSLAGISLRRANQLLKNKQPVRVIVAVIDNGVDVHHVALKDRIWTNAKEIGGNGTDDDHNGFIDDVNGWNFRGARDGTTIENEWSAALQVYAAWKDDPVKSHTPEFERAKKEYLEKLSSSRDSAETRYSANIDYHSDSFITGSPFFMLTPNLTHGTHVAGIIASIASSAIIMPVGASTATGDERDRDVAGAMRYAVDNGARIINISFSKRYSSEKNKVDSAIVYAQKKGVLIIHSSGNDGLDIDSVENYHFPVAMLADGSKATNFITVGWNRPRFDYRLAHPNGDYGKLNVDLYAPGSDIWSTVPGNAYDYKSGSSMSAPVVSGVAALLISYFPQLTAAQLKHILLSSVYKPEQLVNRPQTQEKVAFRSLSVSRGIVNAFNAVQLALRTKTKQN
ncbi:MAG: S8 family serine peptidase [Chitinophagaceae bacterium]|nr:S8 family serine peptidase [Chitinophagaceae bacterium]